MEKRLILIRCLSVSARKAAMDNIPIEAPVCQVEEFFAQTEIISSVMVQAYKSCFGVFEKAICSHDFSLIVVEGPFVTMDQMEPFIKLAQGHGWGIEIRTVISSKEMVQDEQRVRPEREILKEMGAFLAEVIPEEFCQVLFSPIP